jgi:hypothetical protein
MRLRRVLVAGAVAAAITACGQTISAINARPEKYYQEKVRFSARLERLQRLPGEALLEVADLRERRILVHVKGPLAVDIGDWLDVEGILVPEARVGDAVVYDVVTTARVSRTHAPRFPSLQDLM